jgi:hypothetical protein
VRSRRPGQDGSVVSVTDDDLGGLRGRVHSGHTWHGCLPPSADPTSAGTTR